MEDNREDDYGAGEPMARTLIKFRIMPPLYELNRAEIEAASELGTCRFRVTLTDSVLRASSTVEASDGVTVIGDDIGILHNTLVEVEFPALIDTLEIAIGPQGPDPMPRTQRIVLDLLNTIIDHYRLITGATWLRRIPYKHAPGFESVETPDAGRSRRGFWTGSVPLQPTGTTSDVPAGESSVVNEVQRRVKLGAVPLWASLFADGLAEFDANNNRSGLAHLYMALEMLATSTGSRLGEAVEGKEAAEGFLNPKDSDHPSIYQVVKQCRDWAKDGPSKTVLESKVGRVWKDRNDILHGREITPRQEAVQRAIDAFRELAAWLSACQPRQGRK